MGLPFTTDQFLDVFGEYNRTLWPFAAALWAYAFIVVLLLARREASDRSIALLLSALWAWAAVAYHAFFFTRINSGAWLFSALFLLESGLIAWLGLVQDRLHFSAYGSARHVAAWSLIVYAFVYPVLARVDGLVFPRIPTFGVPCPTTLLTIGLLPQRAGRCPVSSR